MTHPSPARHARSGTARAWRPLGAILLTGLLALPTLAALAAAEEDGFYIETMNRSTGIMGEGPQEQLTQTWMAHNRMKVVNQGPDATDMILDPGAGVMTFVNHAEKAYAQLDIKAMMASMSESGMAQMQAIMGDMSVKVEDTGETKRIGDWDCKVYRVNKSGMMAVQQEICAAESVQIDVAPYMDMMNMTGAPGLASGSAAGETIRAEMAKIKGYPILTKTRMEIMGTTMETENLVQVIRREPMPAASFEIPANYERRELGMGGPGHGEGDGHDHGAPAMGLPEGHSLDDGHDHGAPPPAKQ